MNLSVQFRHSLEAFAEKYSWDYPSDQFIRIFYPKHHLSSFLLKFSYLDKINDLRKLHFPLKEDPLSIISNVAFSYLKDPLYENRFLPGHLFYHLLRNHHFFCFYPFLKVYLNSIFFEGKKLSYLDLYHLNLNTQEKILLFLSRDEVDLKKPFQTLLEEEIFRNAALLKEVRIYHPKLLKRAILDEEFSYVLNCYRFYPGPTREILELHQKSCSIFFLQELFLKKPSLFLSFPSEARFWVEFSSNVTLAQLFQDDPSLLTLLSPSRIERFLAEVEEKETFCWITPLMRYPPNFILLQPFFCRHPLREEFFMSAEWEAIRSEVPCQEMERIYLFLQQFSYEEPFSTFASFGREFWKFVIDEKHHFLGEEVYDWGIHGRVEPFYLTHLRAGMIWLFTRLLLQASLEEEVYAYQVLHRICLFHSPFKGRFRKFGELFYIPLDQKKLQIKFELNLLKHPNLTFGLVTSNQEDPLDQNRFTLNFRADLEVRELLTSIFKTFLERQTKDKFVIAILHRYLECLHPWTDGNTRVHLLLLYKVLSENGFKPTRIQDPNLVYFETTQEWSRKI